MNPIKTDIRDDEDIRVFVYAFYDKVRQHDRLGHIFNEVAQVDWDSHLPRMVDFWSNLIFHTRRFSGKPFQKHLPLPIVFQDFKSWLGLFHETIDEHFEGPTAEFTKSTAANIANSFALRMDIEREKENDVQHATNTFGLPSFPVKSDEIATNELINRLKEKS